VGSEESFGEVASIALRPFDVVLLEVVPAGGKATLETALESRPTPAGFAEASRALEVTARWEEPKPSEDPEVFTVLRPRAAASSGGATLEIQADGSVLAGGKNPSPDVYTIVADTDLGGITAFRLEVLSDPGLPSGGPGRAYNGNFALAELSVEIAPRGGGAAEKAKLELRSARADCSQRSHGGWPIEASIDGDLDTAWSVDPEEGAPHVAIFETRGPVGIEGGQTITFTLAQGYRRGPADHEIGRLRLAATTAKPPVAIPRGYGRGPWVVRTRAPATARGGTLAIAAELRRGTAPLERGNIGSLFDATALLEGSPTELRPVLAKETYPSSWQAWRIPLTPSAASRTVELSVKTPAPAETELRFRAFFVPD
jgi:hypothetical protein